MTQLWKEWTANYAAGELLGIASAGAIAYGANLAVGDAPSTEVKVLVLMSMMFAGFVEGAILSYFQWKVLIKKFPIISLSEWMFYTILVAIIGWILGMLPSLFIESSTIESKGVNETGDFANPPVFALLSLGGGLGLGAIFGLFQWFSLRKYAYKAYRWIIANALGWGLGLGWIYLFASLPTRNSSLFSLILMGALGGLFAGLSLGGITGVFLDSLENIVLEIK